MLTPIARTSVAAPTDLAVAPVPAAPFGSVEVEATTFHARGHRPRLPAIVTLYGHRHDKSSEVPKRLA